MNWNFTKEEFLLLAEKESKNEVVLAILLNNKNQVALFKRAASETTNPNKWAFIGGGVDKTDKSLTGALTREIEEESGITLNDFKYVTNFKNGNDKIHMYTKKVNDFKPTLNHEHSDWGWFDLDDLPSPRFSNTKSNFKKALEVLNVKELEPVNEEVKDKLDFIKLDVPLFIRLIEYAREDAKTDMDLHHLAQKAIELTKEKGMLDMNDYQDIIPNTKEKKKKVYEINLDEDYPKEWDVNYFASLGSFNKRVDYARKVLGDPYGSGSSRKVYIVDNEKVLKLAFNQKGVDQNLAELDFHKDFYNMGGGDMVTKVYNYDRRGLWLEAERAEKIKRNDFKQMTGVNFDIFTDYLKFDAIMRNSDSIPTNLKHRGLSDEIERWTKEFARDHLYEPNEFINDLMEIVYDYDGIINIMDLTDIRNYGKVNRTGKPRPVIIDYGLTQDVAKKHYDYLTELD